MRLQDEVINDVTQKVLSRLEASEIALKPKSVRASVFTNGLGEEAWNLVLNLPAPTDSEWNKDEVFEVRRLAVRYFDEALSDTHMTTDGTTLAVITSDDVSGEGIAPEDDPDPEEAISAPPGERG